MVVNPKYWPTQKDLIQQFKDARGDGEFVELCAKHKIDNNRLEASNPNDMWTMCGEIRQILGIGSTVSGQSSGQGEGVVQENPKGISLNERMATLKGKPYFLLHDMIAYFNTKYPNGCITTSPLSPWFMKVGEGKDTIAPFMCFRAVIFTDYKEPNHSFTGECFIKFDPESPNFKDDCRKASLSAVRAALVDMGIVPYANCTYEEVFVSGGAKSQKEKG